MKFILGILFLTLLPFSSEAVFNVQGEGGYLYTKPYGEGNFDGKWNWSGGVTLDVGGSSPFLWTKMRAIYTVETGLWYLATKFYRNGQKEVPEWFQFPLVFFFSLHELQTTGIGAYYNFMIKDSASYKRHAYGVTIVYRAQLFPLSTIGLPVGVRVNVDLKSMGKNNHIVDVNGMLTIGLRWGKWE